MKTLTILSTELKTKLQRQIISAHANGPCSQVYKTKKIESWVLMSSRQKRSSSTARFDYLCKWEANHEKLLVPRTKQEHNQEDCVGIVAEILCYNKLSECEFPRLIILFPDWKAKCGTRNLNNYATRNFNLKIISSHGKRFLLFFFYAVC